jgi:hypothetical protein
MVNANTVYIFEGPETVTILRGDSLIRSTSAPYLFNGHMKHKGFFTQFFPVVNIDQLFIGPTKKLMIADKPQKTDVIFIKKDFLTGEPFIPDVPPTVFAQLKSLRNDCEMWKRKYFDAKRMNEDREQNDRFRQRVASEFDFVAKQRNKFFGSGDSFGGGFASRWGLPGIGTGQTQDTGE